MCFSSSPPKPKFQPPAPAPATPLRSDEQNKSAVEEELENIRRRRGTSSTNLTGGLGDSGYGANAQVKTLLGQ